MKHIPGITSAGKTASKQLARKRAIVLGSAFGTALACLLIRALPAPAQSPWQYIGQDTSNTRHYIQKHNWQGRYRVFEILMVDPDQSEKSSIWVADCALWKVRLRNNAKWVSVLGETVGDARLKYICQ